eukprot:553710_1
MRDNTTIEMDEKKNDTLNNITEYTQNDDDMNNIDNDILSEKDPMSIEINDKRWIPCIPKLSLTAATILFAFIGMAIGATIAIYPTENENKIIHNIKTIYHNTTLDSAERNNASIITVEDMKIINGKPIIIYTESFNVTNMTTIDTKKLSDDWFAILEFPGKLWINSLKLLVLPLIILMMLILPSRVDQIGNVGKKAVPLYLFTSFCASIQGTIIGWTFQPGNIGNNSSSDSENVTQDTINKTVTITETVLGVFYAAVPTNIVIAMYDFMILGCIIFFLCIGLLLRNKKIVPSKERNMVLLFCKAMMRCIMKALVYIIWFSPFGMCSLICVAIASTNNLLKLLTSLGFYALCLIFGLFCHLFIFYPLLLWICTRENGYKFFYQIYEAPLLAFATASSAATLPRSLDVAKKAGISDKIYQFILPLGAAINMDGTAVAYPIKIALICQLNNITLDIGQIFIIMILSVIISVGAAPIPNSGMVYIMMLFESVGLGKYAGQAIGILFVLDWFDDRMQTAVNVSSDQYVAKIIDHVEKIEKIYKNNHNESKKKNVKIICGCCVCGKIDKDIIQNSYQTVSDASNVPIEMKCGQ